MKKQLIPILVISIISLVFSVVMLGIGIWLIPIIDTLPEVVSDSDDAVLVLLAAFGSMVIILVIAIVLVAFAVTALLGAFGLVCALKNGRFSLACLILGAIAVLISLSAFPSLFLSIADKNFEPIFLVPFAYCGTYTACAVIAFIYRKSIVHGQITEKPYELPSNVEENKL